MVLLSTYPYRNASVEEFTAAMNEMNEVCQTQRNLISYLETQLKETKKDKENLEKIEERHLKEISRLQTAMTEVVIANEKLASQSIGQLSPYFGFHLDSGRSIKELNAENEILSLRSDLEMTTRQKQEAERILREATDEYDRSEQNRAALSLKMEEATSQLMKIDKEMREFKNLTHIKIANLRKQLESEQFENESLREKLRESEKLVTLQVDDFKKIVEKKDKEFQELVSKQFFGEPSKKPETIKSEPGKSFQFSRGIDEQLPDAMFLQSRINELEIEKNHLMQNINNLKMVSSDFFRAVLEVHASHKTRGGIARL